jgi:catechol-2,3-dioxygenase
VSHGGLRKALPFEYRQKRTRFADEGLQGSIYYTDPDGNNVELNVNNYGNEWTATEHMKAALPSVQTWCMSIPRRC